MTDIELNNFKSDSKKHAVIVNNDESFFGEKWSGYITKNPSLVCSGVGMFSLVITIIFILMLLIGNFTIIFDAPLMENRQNKAFINFYAFSKIREDAALSMDENGNAIQSLEFESSSVIFTALDSDTVFTVENIQFMREVERHFLEAENFDKYCLLLSDSDGDDDSCNYLSPLDFFYPLKNESTGEILAYNGEGTELADNLDSIVELMVEGLPPFNMSSLFVEEGFSIDNPFSTITRMIFFSGLPLADDIGGTETFSEQKSRSRLFFGEFYSYLNNLSTNSFKVNWFGMGLVDEEVGDLLMTDSILVVFSILFIFVYLYFQLRSFFLASMSTIQILMSFPFAALLQWYIFRIQYFGMMNFMAIFVILGIGADDVFVFVDAWSESAEHENLKDDSEKRFKWAFSRSIKAMFTTSITSFLAFVAATFTPYVALQAFGLFAALLVITNFFYVVTFLPAVIYLYHKTFENWRFFPLDFFKCSSNGKRKRLFAYFFKKHYAPFVRRYRLHIMIFSLCFIIMMGIFAGFTSISNSSLQMTGPGHNIRDVFTILDQFKAKSDDAVNIFVTWGINDVEIDDISKYVSVIDSEFDIDWDDDFDFLDVNAQIYLEGFCDEALQSPGLHVLLEEEAGSMPRDYCFARDFNQWLQMEKGISQRITNDSIVPLIREFIEQEPEYSTLVGLTEEKVQWVMTKFRTDISGNIGVGEGNIIVDNWNTYLEEKALEAPPSAKKAFHHSENWPFFALQNSIVIYSLIAMAFSILLSYVILNIVTKNWIMSLLMLATIFVNVICVLAGFRMKGWGLNLTLSVDLLMVVGFSVDYTVHLGHAYLEASSEDRLLRTTHALETLGVSVVNGAITSFGASLILLFTTVLYFQELGLVIMFIIVFSCFNSLTFFTALCANFGPQKKQGDLSHLIMLLKKNKP